jgi:hypothetical protein
MLRAVTLVVVVMAAAVAPAQPLTTALTYQGRVDSSGAPATGTYDFKFTLFDAPAAGTQLGPQLCSDNVAVAGGTFTVQLDFGSQFAGSQRFLEIWVRQDTGLSCASSTGFTILTPRQNLTAAPNALFSLTATTAATATSATNSSQLNGQPAAFYQNAANLNAGSLADSRLSSNVGLLTGTQTFTGAKTFSTAPAFTNAGAPFSVSSSTLVTNLNADLLDGLSASAFLQTIPNPLALAGSSATHIIRADNSATSIGAAALWGASTAATGSTRGVYGQADSTGGSGVYGFASAATGVGRGVFGQSDSNGGSGVFGFSNAPSGLCYGGFFQSVSASGYAVYGHSQSVGVHGDGSSMGVHGMGGPYGGWFESPASVNGHGVVGFASATTGVTYGVSGESTSTSGFGVFGTASATTGANYGVYGTSSSPSGSGVFGESADNVGVRGNGTNTTGVNYGGYFTTASTTGRGAEGFASAATGTCFGLYGQSDSASGRGVFGTGTATSATDTPYGVRGQASTATAGFAVFAAGDLGASGVKPFRIDHPLDPANKYLLHYSIESPEVLNTYSGKATLNEQGEAVVALPAYFASINKDPRYTLTAIGAPMPLLHIAEEISDEALKAGEQAAPGDPVPTCTFRIAGGAPSGKVSWEVKALRNDLRVRLHGAPVERDKEGPERGKYQHPEYYGLTPDMAMDNAPAPITPPRP